MSFSEKLHYYWTEVADERVINWPLLSSPYVVPLLSLSYLYFVLQCGPRYMKNRPAYSLKRFIQCYNIFQVISNILVVYNFIEAGWFTKYGLTCEPVNYSYERSPYKIANLMWWTLLLKLSDFIETGVFVLRKKYNQVSFLHLYHHISTVVIQWLGTRYIAGGMVCFILIVNCTVHIIMYTYYFLSTLGPQVQKIIATFKPFLTIIQMVQFVFLLFYTMQSLFPSCPVPRLPGSLFIVNLLINLYLFYDFYQKSYKKEGKLKQK